MSSDAAAWYVVHAQANAETKAVANLLRQGFVAYLPRCLKKRRHARRVETVAVPLFPRYLFVAIDAGTQQWRSIQSTVGVSRLVCQGDRPASISAEVINDLKARENEAGFFIPDRPKFAAGDAIRVSDGAFTNCLGLFEGMTGLERVAVLLDLLGRKVRVQLDADQLTAA